MSGYDPKETLIVGSGKGDNYLPVISFSASVA